ncbi:hypothetical protein ABQF26_04620 [Mycolicibacterium elephantis]
MPPDGWNLVGLVEDEPAPAQYRPPVAGVLVGTWIVRGWWFIGGIRTDTRITRPRVGVGNPLPGAHFGLPLLLSS